MKKIIALALTLVLVLSMSVTVFANGVMGNYDTVNKTVASTMTDTSSTGNIGITINQGTNSAAKIYYVTVDWASMTFTYSFNDSTQWNPLTHQYESTSGAATATGTWDTQKITNAITVTNHSNATVTSSVTLATATVNGVTASITGDKTPDSFTLAAADDVALNNFAGADKAIFNVAIDGTPADPAVTTSFQITVTLNS